MVYTPPEPVCQAPPQYLVLPEVRPAAAYFGCCPHAMCMTCHSYTLHASILFILTCKRWSCKTCANQKIKKLAIDVRSARPNRLLTLTIDPSLHESPKAAWENTRRKIPILIRTLRKRFGPIEYMRVTEVTKAGWPHYHLLVRSGYLPQPVVKEEWRKLTGAVIVDLRQVHRSFAAYTYLVKYLAKLHNLGWTERHVSMTRHFVPKREKSQLADLVCGQVTIIRNHPSTYAATFLAGRTLKRISDSAHAIVPEDADAQKFSVNVA
jgi:hypothetical protein